MREYPYTIYPITIFNKTQISLTIHKKAFILCRSFKITMKISSADFITSSAEFSKCPPADKPEYAFIGRSNVGKSSLINALVDRLGLAKTSGKPGKTQLINHFLINKEWYLVDLPGYGYAKVSKSDRTNWVKMINDYLFKRESLMCVFVLIDSRIEPQKIDIEFITKMGTNGIPIAIVFTKTDKLTKTKLETFLKTYEDKLLETWDELPPIFVTSAVSKTGREAILEQMMIWNESYERVT